MAKMNWDRVRRERNLPDYSERMDQADKRLEGTSELPDPMNGVGERPVPPAAPRHLRLNDSADGVWRIVAGRRTRVSAKRARVIDEAARLGITEAEVTARWRRQAPPKRRNLSESAASTASTSTKPSGPAGGRDPAPPRPPRNRTTSFSRPGTGVSPEAVARMRAGAVSRGEVGSATQDEETPTNEEPTWRDQGRWQAPARSGDCCPPRHHRRAAASRATSQGGGRPGARSSREGAWNHYQGASGSPGRTAQIGLIIRPERSFMIGATLAGTR